VSGETIEVSALDDGLTVVTEAMRDTRSVSLGFWVGTGSVDETPERAGASHFLEHLLFKGTATRSARQIAQAVDAVGGDMNAFTTKEYTAFYVHLLADDVELGLDILSDIIWAPSFRSDEVESERQVILEEILMHGDEPDDLVHDLFSEALWPGHPLGREVLGDADTIGALGRDEIAAFHRAHYRPSNLVVAAAGNLSHDRITEGIARRRTGVSGGATPTRHAPAVPGGGVVTDTRKTEQAHLVVGVPGPGRSDEDRHAVGILDHVIGGGMSSRLFQSIREERGLAYSVYSYRLSFEGAGALAVYAGTSPAHAGQVLDLINAELDRVASEGINADELTAAKSHLRGALALGLEDSGSRMSRIGYSQLVHGRVLSVDEVEARMTAVTLDQVNGIAAHLLAAPRTTAAIGPFPDGLPGDAG
jgi:predicted Zn-dependent peptidase